MQRRVDVRRRRRSNVRRLHGSAVGGYPSQNQTLQSDVARPVVSRCAAVSCAEKGGRVVPGIGERAEVEYTT